MRPDTARTPFVTGLLREWWRGTETGQRPLDEAGLSQLLASAGFGEKQTVIPGFSNAVSHGVQHHRVHGC